MIDAHVFRRGHVIPTLGCPEWSPAKSLNIRDAKTSVQVIVYACVSSLDLSFECSAIGPQTLDILSR